MSKVSPFDIVKHLNEKTSLDFEISEYNPWMINKALSFHMQTIPYAYEMNKAYNLDKDIQYRFYVEAVPKGKRYGKWEKKAPNSEIVGLIMHKYSCNNKVALEYASLLNEEQQQKLRENKGGKNGSR